MGEFKLASIIEGWAGYLSNDPLLDKLAVARASECVRCPHAKESAILGRIVKDKAAPNAQGLLCGLCGCPISAKTRRREETCPDGRWRDNIKKKVMSKRELTDSLKIQLATTVGVLGRLKEIEQKDGVDLDAVTAPLTVVRMIMEDMGHVLNDEPIANEFVVNPPPMDLMHTNDKVGALVSSVVGAQMWFKNMQRDKAPELENSEELDAGFMEAAKDGDTVCGMALVQFGRFISAR